MGLLSSCGPNPGADPRIVTVAPEQCFVDKPLLLSIDVPDLRPSLRVDVNQGTLVADLSSLRMTLFTGNDLATPPVPLEAKFWDQAEFFWALTPPNLPAGAYALRVEDPRGRYKVLPNAFESLGPDTTPPTLKLTSDLALDSILGEGSTIVATLLADDGLGRLEQIHWENPGAFSGDCPTPQETAMMTEIHDQLPSTIACPVKFTIAPFADDSPSILSFVFHAWARDVAGNVTVLDIPLRTGRQPTVVSFTDSVGALGGYQPFVVRGRGFIPGSRAQLDGVPIVGTVPGGTVSSDTLIVGWTPPRNRAGAVRVQVVSDAGTGNGPSYFNYVSPPRLRDVEPNHGPRGGGFRVSLLGNDLRVGAQVFIGVDRDTRQLLPSVRHDSDNKLSFCMPPGAGAISLWVYDSITGDGALADAFTYDDDGSSSVGDGGSAAPSDPSCK